MKNLKEKLNKNNWTKIIWIKININCILQKIKIKKKVNLTILKINKLNNNGGWNSML